MKRRSLVVLGIVLVACGPKPPSSLEISDIQVTEGDKNNVIIRFKTAPEAYVVVSVPKDEKTKEGGAEKIVKVKEKGLVEADFFWGSIPNEVNDVDVRITHHLMTGVEVNKKISLNKKPKLLVGGLLRTNPLRVSCRGRAFSMLEGPLHQEGFWFNIDAPSGTKIEFGKDSFTSTGKPGEEMKIDLSSYLLGVRLKDLKNSETPADIKVPMKVSFPDGVVLQEEVALPKERAMKALLPLWSGISKGPITIPGEPAPAGGRSLVYLERPVASSVTSFGADETVGELDLIALRVDLPERTKPCGEYKGGGGTGTFNVSFTDTSIKIYDRRSGKLVKEKTFTAPPLGCPSSINAKASGSSMTSTVKFEALKSFMTSAL